MQYLVYFQVLKVEENHSVLDDVYLEQLRSGETKYSTLRRTRSGNTRTRVAFFEELWSSFSLW